MFLNASPTVPYRVWFLLVEKHSRFHHGIWTEILSGEYFKLKPHHTPDFFSFQLLFKKGVKSEISKTEDTRSDLKSKLDIKQTLKII